MSQAIATLIKQKLARIEERKAEKPGDSKHAMQVLLDYTLYFQGAAEAAEAIGGEGTETAMIKRVGALVDAEINAIEQRLALEADLG